MPNKKPSTKKKDHDEEGMTSLRSNAIHPTCVIAKEDILELADVGKGFYATVKVGHWTRPDKKKKEKVAIKCIKEEVVDDHLAEILTEANNMVKLEHDNIIKLYGICLVTNEDEQCKVKLVTEYARYGSLISVIQDKDEEHHSFFCQITKLWEFACQIAKGMQYLHSKNLIHFDLAARNVLVVTPSKVRISDFGLAKVLCHDKQKVLPEKPIAMAWCAPELFKNQIVTKGCDVWSYGVLLWELMTFGQQPWEGLTREQFMEQADNPNIRLPQPKPCSNAIFDIMQESWNQEPEKRPNFQDIVESLNKAKPKAVSAKNSVWTVRPNELIFQKGTKITIIDRYGTNKYLCQNDKAKVGYVNEIQLNFKVPPVEIKLNRPKIGCPFDMRQTSKEAILKEHKETGVFPVGVETLVALADDPVMPPKPSTSQVQTLEASEQAPYTLMDGGNQDVKQQEIKQPLSKRHSVPPPIPRRDESLSARSGTIPRKKPVPKPRRSRPTSTCFENKEAIAEDLPNLISFEETPAVRKPEEPKPPPLPKRDITPNDNHGVSFPSLPSPPQTAPSKTHDPAKEMPANHSEEKEGLLIDLAFDEDEQNQKEEGATYGGDPPPLPQKDILSRDENLRILPPPFLAQPPRPIPGTSVPNYTQTPTSGTFSVDPSTLTHPSSYRNEVLSTERPVYSKPFPTTLPRLPARDILERETMTADAKPRSKSESSAEKETAYGDEINEGIAKIQSEFPGITKDACYAWILEYKGDIDRIIKILEVCRLTSATEKDAQYHLVHCSWDVQRTVNYIFDNKS